MDALRRIGPNGQPCGGLTDVLEVDACLSQPFVYLILVLLSATMLLGAISPLYGHINDPWAFNGYA